MRATSRTTNTYLLVQMRSRLERMARCRPRRDPSPGDERGRHGIAQARRERPRWWTGAWGRPQGWWRGQGRHGTRNTPACDRSTRDGPAWPRPPAPCPRRCPLGPRRATRARRRKKATQPIIRASRRCGTTWVGPSWRVNSEFFITFDIIIYNIHSRCAVDRRCGVTVSVRGEASTDINRSRWLSSRP